MTAIPPEAVIVFADPVDGPLPDEFTWVPFSAALLDDPGLDAVVELADDLVRVGFDDGQNPTAPERS